MPHYQCSYSTKDKNVLENMDINNSELTHNQENWMPDTMILGNNVVSLMYIFLFSLECYVITTRIYQNESNIMLWINIILQFKVRYNLS